LRKIDPANGQVEKTCDLSIPNPRDIAFDSTHLWLTDGNHDSLYRVDPKTCEVDFWQELPGGAPIGATWGDGHLYVIDSDEKKTYKIDTDAKEIVTEYWLPGNYGGVGLAPITYVNGKLYVWVKDTIYAVNPDDGTELSSQPAPDVPCTAFDFDGASFWSVSHESTTIARLCLCVEGWRKP